MSNIPSNAGKKWTTYDDNKILYQIENNKSYDEIAEFHGRTTKSIECRVLEIAKNMYELEVPMHKIESKTKLSESVIMNWINKPKPESKKDVISDRLDVMQKDIDEIKTLLQNLIKGFEI